MGPGAGPYVDGMHDTDFDGTWPHPPRWFPTRDGRLHYVDLGPRDAPPVVLLHGNPTWGYLYRALIPALLGAGRRVIVPDLLGFGRSDHPSDPRVLTVERHAERLAALLGSLRPRGVALVVHDWGAPIGLSWAGAVPDRIAALVVLNGFVRPPRARAAMPLGLRLFRLPVLGPLAVQGLHALVRVFLFRAGLGRPGHLDATARAAYLAPSPTFRSRAAQLSLARAFPAGPGGDVAAWLGRVHRGLGALAEVPALIVWGGRDVVFGADTLAAWRQDLPRASVIELPGAGHFVQEDAPEQLATALIAFLARQDRPR